MPRYLILTSLLVFTSLFHKVDAQSLLPQNEGEHIRYNAYIEMKKAYISGICIMAYQDKTIMGSIFNEFGVSAIDFTYSPDKDKVKLNSVIKVIDKWYIKRVLRKDISLLLKNMQNGDTIYSDSKHNIKFTMSKLNNTGINIEE